MATTQQVSDLITHVRQAVTDLLETAAKLSELQTSIAALAVGTLPDEAFVGENEGITPQQWADALYAVALLLPAINGGVVDRAVLERIRAGWGRE